jgi:hypothetical protein
MFNGSCAWARRPRGMAALSVPKEPKQSMVSFVVGDGAIALTYSFQRK